MSKPARNIISMVNGELNLRARNTIITAKMSQNNPEATVSPVMRSRMRPVIIPQTAA